MTQIALDLQHPPSYAHDDFIVSDSNRAAYDMVMQWPHWPGPCLWLYGEQSSGKTHLRHIWAQRAGAVLVAGAESTSHSEDLFQGKEALSIDWRECALTQEQHFHLINFAKNENKFLLYIDDVAPSRKDVQLNDLRSRIRAMPAIEIFAPDDVLLHALMMKQLTDRQLRVNSDVMSYILKRTQRSCVAITHIVNELDRQAMQQKRTITLPFVKEILINNPYIIV